MHVATGRNAILRVISHPLGPPVLVADWDSTAEQAVQQAGTPTLAFTRLSDIWLLKNVSLEPASPYQHYSYADLGTSFEQYGFAPFIRYNLNQIFVQ